MSMSMMSEPYTISNSWDCLACHPRIPFAARFGLPVLDLALILMFAASHLQATHTFLLSLKGIPYNIYTLLSIP